MSVRPTVTTSAVACSLAVNPLSYFRFPPCPPFPSYLPPRLSPQPHCRHLPVNLVCMYFSYEFIVPLRYSNLAIHLYIQYTRTYVHTVYEYCPASRGFRVMFSLLQLRVVLMPFRPMAYPRFSVFRPNLRPAVPVTNDVLPLFSRGPES